MRGTIGTALGACGVLDVKVALQAAVLVNLPLLLGPVLLSWNVNLAPEIPARGARVLVTASVGTAAPWIVRTPRRGITLHLQTEDAKAASRLHLLSPTPQRDGNTPP